MQFTILHSGGMRNSADGTVNLAFIYDENGRPYSLERYNSSGIVLEKYHYITNVQGDVIRLIDENNEVIANYAYDAWGKLISITDAGGNAITASNHIAIRNPIRYRGYFYDEDTKLYYCNSRYYDPQTRRFINADDEDVIHMGPGEFTNKNLFAYCDNNPVMRYDNGGEWWHVAVGALIGGGAGFVSKLISNAVEGNDNLFDGVLTATVSGAASGALASSSVSLAGSIIGNAGISMVANVVNQVVENKGFDNFDTVDMLVDGAVGAVAGAVGGKGAGNYTNMDTLDKNLTKKVLSGSMEIAKQGFKYYYSQTKFAYKNYYLVPIVKGTAATLVGGIGKLVYPE